MSSLRDNQGPPLNDDLLEDLSAFMDGELDAQRSRFLLQRLAHDAALRARFERWQLQAGAMRKMAQPLPAGFAERVGRAIDADAAAAASAAPRFSRRTRWAGGLALAASFAVAGLFVFNTARAPHWAPVPKVALDPHAAAEVMPIARTTLPAPEPTIQPIQLPIPVRAGVVTAYRQPLSTTLASAPAPTQAKFQPFPQPYAIDPDLAAYLQDRKSGQTRDVFTEDALNQGSDAVRTVSWTVP
ncbi:MAG: hypothetical protein JSR34_09395 [Proteobacteria bacterium]|nr:hypothetical protein [Pseudomonadota bacterium]